MNPVVETWKSRGIGPNYNVSLLFFEFHQIFIVLLPIFIDAGKIILAFLGNVRARGDRIEVETEFFELGKAGWVEALPSNLVVQLTLASDPVSKLDIHLSHTTDQTIPMLLLILLQLAELLVPPRLKPPLVIILRPSALQRTKVESQGPNLGDPLLRQRGMIAPLKFLVLLARFHDKVSEEGVDRIPGGVGEVARVVNFLVGLEHGDAFVPGFGNLERLLGRLLLGRLLLGGRCLCRLGLACGRLFGRGGRFRRRLLTFGRWRRLGILLFLFLCFLGNNRRLASSLGSTGRGRGYHFFWYFWSILVILWVAALPLGSPRARCALFQVGYQLRGHLRRLPPGSSRGKGGRHFFGFHFLRRCFGRFGGTGRSATRAGPPLGIFLGRGLGILLLGGWICFCI
mmetsp:Transcript_9012/g.19461  ORF Transcript_9012/g.19461 Transcript_9012/m.19461 type:complete len:399 (+) Transcript_9012:1395-2591(+)